MKTHRHNLRIFLLATLTVAMLSARGAAQTGVVGTLEGDKVSLDQTVLGIGTNFSLLSGMGLSFKEHFAKSRFSYMLTGYVYKDRSGGVYDYGAELQYDVYLKQETRFYAFIGLGYFYNSSMVTNYDPITGESHSALENTLTGPQRYGCGAGFESTVSSSACIYVNVALTSFQPDGSLYIYPYGGMMFYFK